MDLGRYTGWHQNRHLNLSGMDTLESRIPIPSLVDFGGKILLDALIHAFVPMERLSLLVFDEGEWLMHPSQSIGVIILLFHLVVMLGLEFHATGFDKDLWFDRLGPVIGHPGILSS